MLRVLAAAIALLAVAGGGVGAYYAVAGGGGEDAAVSQATPTPTPTAVTATPTAPGAKGGQESGPKTPTSALQTYRNDKYGYEVSLPEGYRAASFFMKQFAVLISNPRVPAVPEDNIVITSLTEEEERAAVQEASETVALGLAPWFGFGQGKSVRISLIQPEISREDLLKDVNMAGIIRSNSEIREETLDSGELAIRLTRRDVDDNGDFTYDMVLAPFGASDENTVVFRIVKTPEYAKEEFETIFRSFRDE
jgi:hypothetical protein